MVVESEGKVGVALGNWKGDGEMENSGKELICGEGLCIRTCCFSGGLVKNVPEIQETWVRSQETLGWEDPLEKGRATHANILAWRNPMDKGAWWAIVHEVSKSWIRMSD